MPERRIAGRYQLTRELGAGSTGTVYLADDLVLRRCVAVKVASRAGSESDEGLRQEFDLLGRLRHPNLPEVYEFGRDPADGVSFFSMEYVEGLALDAALAALGPAHARDLLAQALRALGFHHSRGLVHGDLKPANVLVTTRSGVRPRLKLIDLGLSGPAGEGEPGVVRGTPRFSAASVLGGRPPTEKSDLYALGASFLAALEGLDPGSVPGAPPADVQRVLRRLTAEDEDARYQSAEHALQELEPSLAWPGGGEGVAVEPLFVGRAAEMARLAVRLEELLAGGQGPPLTLVVGEAGIGKSRLADELARLAEQRWVTVCRGRSAAGTPIPWLPLRGVLRHLGILLDEEQPQLARRIGRLLVRMEGTPDEPSTVEAAGELGLRDDLRRALGEAARGRPLLLVLEDLQWIDRSSAAFLQDVAWRGFDGPVWTVGAVRAGPGEAPGLPVDDPESLLTLARLGPDDAARLIASLFEGVPPPETALQRLVEVTEGHPGFAEAAARAVAEAGEGLSAAELDRTVVRRLPASQAEALDLRLAGLSREELRLARELAILGRPVPSAFLARSTGLPPEALAPTLEALVHGALVRREGHGPAALHVLRSDTLRLRLLDATPPEELRVAHRRALDAWLAEEDGSGAQAEVVAEHALACGARSEAVHHGGRAIRRALARQAPEAALEWCARLARLDPGPEERLRLAEWEGDACLGLGRPREAEAAFAAALEHCPADGVGGGGGARYRLLRKRAFARVELGEHEGAQALLEEALASATGGVPTGERAQVHALLGRVSFTLGRVEAAERHLQTGLDELGDEDDPAASSLWNNLGVIAQERSDYERSERCHRRALAIRQRHGDEEGRSRSLTNLGNLALIAGRHVEARRLYEEALALKRRFGNRQTLARSLSNLALLDAGLGHYGVAIQRHEEALRHREAVGDASGVVFSHRHLAEVWHEKGELEKARGEARAAVVLARRLGQQDRALCGALTIEAAVEATLGRGAQAEVLLGEALALAREIDCSSDVAMARLVRARVLRDAGDLAAALREQDEAVALLRGAGDPQRLGLALVESAALRLGDDLGGAETLGAEAARLVPGLQDRLLSTRVEHVQGEIALRRGRIDEASERLHRAMDWAGALSVPEPEWRAAVALAAFHRRQGREERGILWLRRALQVFRRVLSRLGDPELERSYLAAPERAAVLRLLERWLG